MGMLDDQEREEWCKVVAIDRRRKVRMEAELRDKDGDLIDLHETMEGLTEHVIDKMKSEEPSIIQQQIFPVMAKAAVTALTEFLGPQAASAMVSQEMFRQSLTYCMMTAFLLMHFIEENDISIYTDEQPVTDEELEHYDRINKATSIASLAGMMGANPREVVREMLKSGQLEHEDLKALGLEDMEDDEVEKKDSN